MRLVAASSPMRVFDRERRGERAGAELPSNLVFSPMYREVLAKMVQRSHTFRRQCLRLAQARRVTVTLRNAHPNAPLPGRARTNIMRVDGGFDAIVDIRPLDDTVELIAHELEHVIEQIDGVDLKTHAALANTGVTIVEDGTYETIRATRIGTRVARETRGAQ